VASAPCTISACDIITVTVTVTSCCRSPNLYTNPGNGHIARSQFGQADSPGSALPQGC